jgi:hypothetical protein
MDDDLENYVKELERIEKEDVSVQEKSLQLKVQSYYITLKNISIYSSVSKIYQSDFTQIKILNMLSFFSSDIE